MEKIAIYPGTFDPITKGHVDLIKRSCLLFDKVLVAVANNTRKHTWLSPQERITLLKETLAPFKKVSVLPCDGMVVNFAREHKATFIVRGIRTAADYEHEFLLAGMNRQMAPDVETIFLPANDKYAFISATLVREITTFQGDISPFVPENVLKLLRSWQKIT